MYKHINKLTEHEITAIAKRSIGFGKCILLSTSLHYGKLNCKIKVSENYNDDSTVYTIEIGEDYTIQIYHDYDFMIPINVIGTIEYMNEYLIVKEV